MKIYLEAGSGFKTGKDVYGNEIVGSADSAETVKFCAEFLAAQPEIGGQKIEIVQTKNAISLLEGMHPEDILISIHLDFYRDSAGVGLRGFYRSTRKHNSEKCKALAITVTKGLRDHIDMYYHGVFNEQRDKHSELEPIVTSRALAALISVGFKEEFKNKVTETQVHKNIATGIVKGIIRYLNASR